MKFRVQMHDPDALPEAAKQAAKDRLRESPHPPSTDVDTFGQYIEESCIESCGKWFEYNEYLTVEIDTEAGTCVVVERGK